MGGSGNDDFRAMFTLFKMSEKRVQRDVASRYKIAGPVLLSWLQTLNYIRIICAHHARLWNRELAIKPFIPDSKNDPRWHAPRAIANNRPFVVLTLLHFMLRQIAPQALGAPGFTSFLTNFPTFLWLRWASRPAGAIIRSGRRVTRR